MKTANNNLRSAGSPAQIPAVEPKTIIAVVLVGAMLVLWGRVLMRSKMGPAAASADTVIAQTETAQQASVRIQAVKLPILEGRHDRIGADIFSIQNQFKAFDWGSKQSQSETGDAAHPSERLLSDLAAAIILEAVIVNAQSQPDKASINGVLVSVGSAVEAAVGKEKYTLEVKAIKSKQVELTWQGQTIISKMPDYESGQ